MSAKKPVSNVLKGVGVGVISYTAVTGAAAAKLTPDQAFTLFASVAGGGAIVGKGVDMALEMKRGWGKRK